MDDIDYIDDDLNEVLRAGVEACLSGNSIQRVHHTLTRLRTANAELTEVVERLRKIALAVAVEGLMQHEPGDSRAVSDVVVALACIASGNDDEKCWDIVTAALPTNAHHAARR